MCSLTSAEQRGTVLFLDLLAEDPSFPEHCWLSLKKGPIVGSLSTKCPAGQPRSSLQKGFAAEGCLTHGFVPTHMQDFAFPHAELQEVPVRPLLQPVQVPLKGSIRCSWVNKGSTNSFLCGKKMEVSYTSKMALKDPVCLIQSSVIFNLVAHQA